MMLPAATSRGPAGLHAPRRALRRLWVLAALGTAACGGADAPPAEDTPAPAPTPAPGARQREASDGPVALTPDGWGPLRIGMSRAEVVAALGEDAHPGAVGGPEPDRCDEWRPARAPAGMIVMIEQGRLTRISLVEGSEVVTEAGLGVGDSAAAVRSAHGAGAESTPHKYLPAPAEYVTVWTTPPPAPGARGIVYEIGTDRRVHFVRAGGPSIRYVEGCL